MVCSDKSYEGHASAVPVSPPPHFQQQLAENCFVFSKFDPTTSPRSSSVRQRRTHQVDGVLTKRSTRVSLTFRRVRDPAVACTCDFEKSCDRDKPVATATFLKKEADNGMTGEGTTTAGAETSPQVT